MAATCPIICDVRIRNYTVERGIQFSRQVTVTSQGIAVDLTGATFLGNVRLSQLPVDVRPLPKNTGPIITTLDITPAVDPTTGVFTFGLSKVKTLLLVRADFDYDIVVTFASTDKQRFLKGILTAVEVSSAA